MLINLYFDLNGVEVSTQSYTDQQINFGSSLKVYVGNSVENIGTAKMFVYKIHLTNSINSFDMGDATTNQCG